MSIESFLERLCTALERIADTNEKVLQVCANGKAGGSTVSVVEEQKTEAPVDDSGAAAESTEEVVGGDSKSWNPHVEPVKSRYSKEQRLILEAEALKYEVKFFQSTKSKELHELVIKAATNAGQAEEYEKHIRGAEDAQAENFTFEEKTPTADLFATEEVIDPFATEEVRKYTLNEVMDLAKAFTAKFTDQAAARTALFGIMKSFGETCVRISMIPEDKYAEFVKMLENHK